MISVKVNGNAIMEGIDESGMAQRGSRVMIEVTEPGYTLAKLTKDDKGNDVYTAMKLNYDNQYEFTAEEAAEFYVVDPEKAAYSIAYSNTRQAKLTGAAGLKLTGLTSSAQSYNEIVLNFNAVKNGSDGTETEAAYYEVKVTALPKEGEHLPAGSSTTPQYYYIPKAANQNTQSKSIIVNDGDLAAPTACTYGFSVRMVLLDRTKTIDESTPLTEPLTVSLEGNSLTKSFATKGMLYYEDKISFTKKKTAIYSGEQNILAGTVKYSKNASYIHDLTAYAYDSKGVVVPEIACSFKNDNDELYVSAESWVQPGKYKIIVYAGIGEKDATSGKPQGGTMYQSNTSFTLTIYNGISWIDVGNISDRVFVHSKDVTFSAVPIGNGPGGKAKTQKFTYEIQGAVLTHDEEGDEIYTVAEPTDTIKNNVTVNKSGKVTVKKGFYVDPDSSKNRIAVVIKAADYEGNTTENVKFVEISATALVPTEIYLTDSKGNRLGTTLSADRAEWADVIVLDQNGNNMTAYAVITPNNSKGAAYVYHSVGDSYAKMHVNKPTTVSIKATATDGSKQSKTVKIQITEPYISQGQYMLWHIKSNGFYIWDYNLDDGANGRVTYNAPKGAVITYQLGGKFNDSSYYKRGWYNWGYSVTGGKLKFDGDNWVLTPTAKTAQVRAWMKSNPKRYYDVYFTNTSWDTTYEKPPTVKLVSGKLYSDRYSNESELHYYEDEDGEIQYVLPNQELTYQYEYGSYDEVKIVQLSSAGPGLDVKDFDPMNRTFRLFPYSSYLRPGSYKYSIAFYNNGQLMSKPATITVKVNKSAPVKVTASYTLNTALGQSVALKSTPTEFVPDYEALLNANIKGKANDFNKYFELAYNTNSVTGEKTAVIKLKDTVTPAELESIRGKKQTGYVKYSYYYGYSHVEHVTTKLTITVK